MGEYVSMVSGTRQYQEAKLWVYQSRNHLKRASKERSNTSIPALKAKKKEAMLCINLHLLEMLVFNFVYYDSNDELRVDEEAILRMDPNSDNYESWQEALYFFK